MFHYLTTPNDWNLIGVPGYLEKDIVDPDPYIIFSLNQMFPKQQYISEDLYYHPGFQNIIIKSDDPNFKGAEITVTFINVLTSKLDTLGYTIFHLFDEFDDKPTLVDPITGQRRLITRQDIIDDDNSKNPKNIMNRTILFPVCNRIDKTNYLPRGATIRLKPILQEFAYQEDINSGLFVNNIAIGFFIIPDGWGNQLEPKGILYGNDYLNLCNYDDQTSGYVRQNLIMYNEKRSNQDTCEMIITFNDNILVDLDKDFSDLQIKIKITPSSCINQTDYLQFQEIERPNYSSFILDNYGFYICLSDHDYAYFIKYPKITFEHIINSNTPSFNSDLYNIFSNLYFNNSNSKVIMVNDTSFSIQTSIDPTLIPHDNKTIHIFKTDENAANSHHDNLFSAYITASGNDIDEHINVYVDGNLYQTLCNNSFNRVDLTYYSDTIPDFRIKK